MKKNTKKKLRLWTKEELLKRYNYLKSKLPKIRKQDTREMRYIQYYLKRRLL